MTLSAGVLLSVLSAAGWAHLLSFVIRVTVIAALGFILCSRLRKASAAKRHLAAMATLVALIALPIAMVILPAVRLPILPAAARPTIVRADASAAVREERGSSALLPAPVDLLPKANGEPAARETPRRDPAAYVVLTSLAFSAALLLHVLVSFLSAAFAVRRARRVDDAELRRELESACRRLGVSRAVGIRECPSITVPAVWGFVRPVLLLPVEARRWDRERLRVVFLHEVAHVARHDGVSLLLTRIATSVFWFHPLVWKLARVVRRECERCCDDLVLAAGERATDYAAHLLDMVRSMARPDRFAGIAPALAQESNLEGRLVSILRAGQRRDSISRSGFAIAIAVASLLLIATTVVQVVAAPESEDVWEQVKRANREAREHARDVEAAAMEAALQGGADRNVPEPSTCVDITPPAVPTSQVEVSVKPETPATMLEVPETPAVPGVPTAPWPVVSVAVSPVYSVAGSRHRSRDSDSGIELMRDGQYSRAIAAFQEEIRQTGGSNSMYNLACAYALSGDKKLAFDSLQKAIENGFDNTSHMTEDEDLRSLQGDPHFYELVRLARDLQLFSSGHFGGMNGEKDWSSLVPRLERVTREHPTIGRAWANLGLARLEAGDPKGGLAAYQKALDLGYEKPNTLYNLACCASRSGDIDGAFKYLDRADQAGFEIGEYVGSDSDMDALRGDARYGAMLKRWDEKMAKEHRAAEAKQKTD